MEGGSARSPPDRPWPAGDAARVQLPEPFTYGTLLPMMDEAGVDRAITVPPSWEGDRNDYALEAARARPDRFCVMGRIPLRDKEAARLLAAWKAQPGMLAVRVTFLRALASCSGIRPLRGAAAPGRWRNRKVAGGRRRDPMQASPWEE